MIGQTLHLIASNEEGNTVWRSVVGFYKVVIELQLESRRAGCCMFFTAVQFSPVQTHGGFITSLNILLPYGYDFLVSETIQ